MAFDFKKEYKEFYLPKNKPGIIKIPPMNYLAVRGKGDPNAEDGEYKNSIGLLYAIAFTLKMSYKGDYKIKGFFQYVVPPLEGFWWQEDGLQRADNVHDNGNAQNADCSLGGDGSRSIDYSRKADLNFISAIRLPDFVTQADFDWAIAEVTKKKGTDFSKVEFFSYDEGTCVQCMHIGPYDDEPATVGIMHQYMGENGYELDIQNPRYHHEIYLSDPRRCDPKNLKTVVRHPVKEA